jgi:hypothetical protein
MPTIRPVCYLLHRSSLEVDNVHITLFIIDEQTTPLLIQNDQALNFNGWFELDHTVMNPLGGTLTFSAVLSCPDHYPHASVVLAKQRERPVVDDGEPWDIVRRWRVKKFT